MEVLSTFWRAISKSGKHSGVAQDTVALPDLEVTPMWVRVG